MRSHKETKTYNRGVCWTVFWTHSCLLLKKFWPVHNTLEWTLTDPTLSWKNWILTNPTYSQKYSDHPLLKEMWPIPHPLKQSDQSHLLLKEFWSILPTPERTLTKIIHSWKKSDNGFYGYEVVVTAHSFKFKALISISGCGEPPVRHIWVFFSSDATQEELLISWLVETMRTWGTPAYRHASGSSG